MDHIEDIDGLIAKHIAGECTPGEVRQLIEWRRAESGNEDYYQESLKLFQTIEGLDNQGTVNVQAAWQKVEERISGGGGARVIPLFTRRNIFRAAASLLLLMTLGLLMYNVMYRDTDTLKLSAGNSVKEKKLPDGSKVFLNKETELVFETGTERKATLRGEAYFEVKHDDARPFIVEAGEVFIRDVGTSFNVVADPESDAVAVYVDEGEVFFYKPDGRGMSLVKGEAASYNKSTGEFARLTRPQLVNQNISSYRTRVFQFVESRLGDVVQQLNQVYETKIQLQDKALEECLVSVQFNNERPEMIVEILAETLDLQVKDENGLILLSGHGCKSER